jgi:hypothetical protein
MAIEMTITDPDNNNQPINVDTDLSGIVACLYISESNTIVQNFSRDAYNSYKTIESLGSGKIRIVIEPEQTRDIVGVGGRLAVKLQKTNALFTNGQAYRSFIIDLTSFSDCILKNEMDF